MTSFDQFIGLLRSCLRESRDIEVALGPDMLTAYLFMSTEEWQRFAIAAFQQLSFHVEQRVLSNVSTIRDLYCASLSCCQPDLVQVSQHSIPQHGRGQRRGKSSARLH